MKTKLSILLAALALCGCASTSTYSTTDYYGPNGELVAQETERTRRLTAFQRTEASRIDATMRRTNAVTSGTATFTSTSEKVFGTGGYKTEVQGDAIKSAGDAVGTAAGAILKKAVTP